MLDDHARYQNGSAFYSVLMFSTHENCKSGKLFSAAKVSQHILKSHYTSCSPVTLLLSLDPGSAGGLVLVLGEVKLEKPGV